MTRDRLSSDSIQQASKSRVDYSGHGDAAGASGARPDQAFRPEQHLGARGQDKLVVIDQASEAQTLSIGLAWNNIVQHEAEGLINRLMKKVTKSGVDLDLGCLYELKNGDKGSIQAFGEMFGDFDKAPYIALSGDERTGDAEGDDEVLTLNLSHWQEMKRVLVYAYIYEGPTDWEQIAPDLTLRMQAEEEVHITADAAKLKDLNICALLSLENHKDGIRMTNMSEYFPSHPAMDRAFGFGLKWAEGEKS